MAKKVMSISKKKKIIYSTNIIKLFSNAMRKGTQRITLIVH